MRLLAFALVLLLSSVTTIVYADDGGSYSRPLTDTSVYDDGGSYSVPRGCESRVWPADDTSSFYGKATDSNGQK